MRLEQRRLATALRLHSRPRDEGLRPFTPEEVDADDPHTFRVVTEFRRAHGLVKGATTLLGSTVLTHNIDSRRSGARDT